MHVIARAGLCGLALIVCAAAQSAAPPVAQGTAPSTEKDAAATLAGHYEGTLAVPNRDIQIAVDIDRNAKQEWVGSTSLTPGPNGLLLENITLNGDTVSWSIGMPNAPTFKGKWDKETKTIKGAMTAGGNDLPLELKRTGDAKVAVPVPSTPVSKEIEGKWAGAVQTPGGQTLRLELELTNAGGKGEAVITSLDQGNAKIPAASVTQKGSDLEIDLRVVGAKFTGKVSADNATLDGSLAQAGGNMPLKFTRPAPRDTVK